MFYFCIPNIGQVSNIVCFNKCTMHEFNGQDSCSISKELIIMEGQMTGEISCLLQITFAVQIYSPPSPESESLVPSSGSSCNKKLSHHFSRSVVSHSLWPHGLQPARLPCPSPTPGACSSSCPLTQWCHPTVSSSVVPFSSHLQSFPASGSFLVS